MKSLFILTMFAVSMLSNGRSATAQDIIFAPLPMEQKARVFRHVRPMLLKAALNKIAAV
jgi:hypothetical protein